MTIPAIIPGKSKCAAGDLITAVAPGSTTHARMEPWVSPLASASVVLVPFDAGDSGDDAASYWLRVLPNARRWRPYWGFPNSMLEADYYDPDSQLLQNYTKFELQVSQTH